MTWFEGSVIEAIQRAKRLAIPFIVLCLSDNDESVVFETLFYEEQVFFFFSLFPSFILFYYSFAN